MRRTKQILIVRMAITDLLAFPAFEEEHFRPANPSKKSECLTKENQLANSSHLIIAQANLLGKL